MEQCPGRRQGSLGAASGRIASAIDLTQMLIARKIVVGVDVVVLGSVVVESVASVAVPEKKGEVF